MSEQLESLLDTMEQNMNLLSEKLESATSGEYEWEQFHNDFESTQETNEGIQDEIYTIAGDEISYAEYAKELSAKFLINPEDFGD